MIRIMEICGTHTMEIARAGIRRMLPDNVRLISGPGCPVCVTPPEVIDAVLALASQPDVIIATYGDMVRVPGSVKGDNLLRRGTDGADVRIVYSATDAIRIARENPVKQVVFLGVGFETSAPGMASAVGIAAEEGIANFSVFSMLKLVEPPVRALALDPDFAIDGFLCPGHVAVILGEEGLRFIAEDLHLPAVIAGFEPAEIMRALTLLTRQILAGEAQLQNAYTRVVRPEGNEKARQTIDKYLEIRDDIWRGLGTIPLSGLKIRGEYADFDAERRFAITIGEPVVKSACRCGDVIRGKLNPPECALFGSVCTPDDPEGPCMVSAEGACAAAYKYRDI